MGIAFTLLRDHFMKTLHYIEMRQPSYKLSKMQFHEYVALAPLTTFGIGGPARWFAEASTEEEIVEAVTFAHECQLPLFILGGGSNLLVSDAGFPGLVLHIALQGVEVESGASGTVFRAAAGEDWDCFVRLAIAHECGGVECLAGIPGTVGGTPIQNVGAYGQEVSETILRVRAYDRVIGQFIELPKQACAFSYRHSMFNSTARNRYIVTRVDYSLTSGTPARIAYADLQRRFSSRVGTPSLAEVAEVVREIRRGKGMLLLEGDPDCHSAGSFFKNPVLSDSQFADIKALEGVDIPHYPAGAGKVKVPAAWLMERAGFSKGYTLGRAGISSRHTLALINRGGATSADIYALRDVVVLGVKERFGIILEPEPVAVG
jgi:UDP-N-acetylmuramate dehydrogenase